VQLHCPPTEVYYSPEVFEILEDLVQQGKIHYYGVSVEKVEEALKAIEYPNLQTVQIIFNIFRQRPTDLFFQQASQKQVGILARLPLSSGMLAGRMTREQPFPKMTTADTTGSENPLTGERHSRVLISRLAWKRLRSCGRSSQMGGRWRSLPCAGSWNFRR
jgi:aryl-alcohol dehydrogenase-like predicted oxidoreductase